MSKPLLQKHDLAGKRIIVAGAGLAALAFARALEQDWPQDHPRPEVVMYERSSKSLDRGREGYTMGIRTDTGLYALKKLGLLDAALQSATTGADGSHQSPTFWKSDWQSVLDLPATPLGADGAPPRGIRLVRHVLRQILLEALPTDTEVHWDTGCDSAHILDDGRVRVKLSTGSTDDCDLLIAADGANSSIRSSLLPHDTLDFAGVVCFLGTSRFPAGKPGLLKNKWGINVGGQGVPFLTFPVDSTTGVWALSYRTPVPRDAIRGKEALERNAEILAEVCERGKVFHEPFHQFIEATDPETLQVFNARHKSPIRHSQALPNANVVFIGDANHAMSPLSGNGANMALVDAIELAKQLSNCADVRMAIDNFDAESAPRSQKAVDWSKWVIWLLHSQGIAYCSPRVLDCREYDCQLQEGEGLVDLVTLYPPIRQGIVSVSGGEVDALDNHVRTASQRLAGPTINADAYHRTFPTLQDIVLFEHSITPKKVHKTDADSNTKIDIIRHINSKGTSINADLALVNMSTEESKKALWFGEEQLKCQLLCNRSAKGKGPLKSCDSMVLAVGDGRRRLSFIRR